jgi:hypothetical protein
MADAAELIERFNAAVDAFVALVASCTPDEWQVICPDEGWTVAAEADHVAVWIDLERDWITKVAFAEPMIPLALDAVNDFNDRRAHEQAAADRQAVLELLERNRAQSVAFMTSLTAE